MNKQLKVTLDGMELFNGEVVDWSFSEKNALVTITASPPRAAGQPQNPALAALSQTLKANSRAASEQAAAEAAKA